MNGSISPARARSVRPSRRQVLRGAGIAGTGSAVTALLAGCSTSNNGSGRATAAATRSISSGTAQPASTGAAAPRIATPAAGTAVASASTAAGVPNGQVLSKLPSEKDFFAQLPDMPPKDFNDADIKAGGTFNRLFNRDVPFDFMTTQLTGPTAEVIQPVYNRLIRLSCAAGALKTGNDIVLEADLATKWERPDPQTLVLTLAPGVKWQNAAPLNGRAFSVDDVKFSFNRGATFDKSIYKQFFQQFSAVEDAGNGQIRLKLAEPNPAAELLIASFFMNIMPPEIGNNADTAATSAMGTGPFVLDHHTPNVEYVYKKNPNFWKKDAQGRQKPYIDGFTDLIVNDAATRLAMFQKGDVDSGYLVALPLSQDNAYSFAKQNPNFVWQGTSASQSPFQLVGHFNQAPFSDLRVRRALSLLVDRRTITDTLFKGQAAISPFLPWPSFIDKRPVLEDLGPWFKYDPQQAKQLLSAAGFPSGLSMDFNWYQATPPEDEMVLLQQQAAAGGVKYNLIKSADATAHTQKQASKNWSGLIMFVRGLEFPDPMSSLPPFLPGSGTNFGDVGDAKLADLYNAQKGLLGDQRRAVLKQAWDLMLDQIYEIGAPFQNNVVAWRPWWKNFRDATWGSASAGFGNGQFDSVWLGAKS